ncbi:MAG: hypothetical protein IKQ30_13455 [Bacteroidales bacterium]|jgi:hypothetical protein|nr:hypothetical protein [Bacteroidales bacterium]
MGTINNRRRNYLLRVKLVSDIVEQHYEPGSYANSYYKVWRKYVYPQYPMCYRTMLNYVSTPVPRELRQPEAVQLKLWEE